MRQRRVQALHIYGRAQEEDVTELSTEERDDPK
jgi:hypothetical protein